MNETLNNILVIDDDPTNLKMLLDLLRQKGYKIHIATDAFTAFTSIKYERPDLILLDIMMPGLDGFEVCRRLKSHSSSQDIPIIFMTALTDALDEIKGFELGAVDYITKPFSVETVLARINTQLALQNLKKKFQEQNARLHQEIEQHQRTEKELVRAKELAESANTAKSDFLARVSHEIRTPMNAIIGLSHLALQTQLTPKQQDYVTKIHSSAHYLLRIVNDILDFSRIEAGRLEIEAIQFTLAEVLNSVSDVIGIEAEKKGLEMIFEVDEDVPRSFIGDPLRLGQILINLTSNAVKFTKEGEILVAIRVLDRHDQLVTLQISVKDSGVGISREKIPNLFHEFSQADGSTTREYGGSGLGLAICQRLVELMNGHVWVESEVNQGSTFTFTIEVQVCEEIFSDQNTIPPEIQGLKVLVVDDSRTSRKMLYDTLSSMSFNVSVARSGGEALTLIEHAPHDALYDLLIMDWKMPDMDGIETVRRLHMLSNVARLPKSIMLSAYGRQELMQLAEKTGISAFLIKPASSSILLETILTLFENECGLEIVAPLESGETVALPKGIAGKTVLVVEDNPINQQLLQELLEHLGIQATVVATGTEAITLLQRLEFDLVLMDIQMPGMDGYTATRHIRQFDSAMRDVPVIAITAHAMTGEREKCLAAGMNDYLLKPIDPKQLYSTLEKWLHSRFSGGSHINRDTQPQDDSMIDLPGIRVKEGVQRTAGNYTLYKKLLRDFSADYHDANHQVQSLIQTNQQEELCRYLHTLKGVAGNIGAADLADAAQRLERCFSKGLPDESEDTAQHLFSLALENVQTTLRPLLTDEPEHSELPDDTDKRAKRLRLAKKLAHLLEEGDAEAVDVITLLKPLLEGTTLAAQLEASIANYDFEDARTILLDIMSTYEEVR